MHNQRILTMVYMGKRTDKRYSTRKGQALMPKDGGG